MCSAQPTTWPMSRCCAGYVNMRDLLDYDTLVITQGALSVLEGVLS